MPPVAPRIDTRTYDELVKQLEELVRHYTDEAWQPASADEPLDPGGALIRLFARLAEVVIARLNRVPEKSFLAFLDLIGARPGPPRPARAPLTFHLAAGSPVDALVPAGTLAAAPPREGEKAPALYETERSLVVTRSRLAAVVVHDPGADRWSDRTDSAIGAAPGVFDPFAGTDPIEHALFLRHPWLAEPPEKQVVLTIRLADAAVPWPGKEEMGWEIPGDGGWTRLAGHQVALSSPGVWAITLFKVPPLAETAVAGRTGPWLRGHLIRPIARSEALPWITDLTVAVQVQSPQELAPDLAFVNQTQVDPKEDFFPFGEKPKVGDALYLASDEAFARKDAQITLHLTPTNPNQPGQLPPPANPSDDLKLEWQRWNGSAWETFGTSGPKVPEGKVKDGTYGFRDAGDVTFTCPEVNVVAVGGHARRWIRVRLAAGNYGFEATFGEVKPPLLADGSVLRVAPPAGDAGALPEFRFVPASFKPPSLSSVRLSYDYTSNSERPTGILTINDFEVRSPSLGRGFPELPGPILPPAPGPVVPPPQPLPAAEALLRQAVPAAGFAPFVPSAENRPALYLGFERPGDANGFANQPVALYFGLDEALYEAALTSSTPPLPEGEEGEKKKLSSGLPSSPLSPGERGAGGVRAAAAAPPGLAWQSWSGSGWQPLGVRDETRGFTRRGLVTFIGPPVFPSSRRFDRTAFWLRIRWEHGDWSIRPGLRRVLTNTVWAVNAQTVTGEVLGSSRGERDQTFRTRRVPVLPGQRLEVHEPEIPTAAERKALERELGEDPVRLVMDAAGHPAEVWVRWHEVPDFYGSDPRSRHYVVDRANGEVRFGDGRRGLVPPPGTGNVRMALYRVGGGPAGNRPAGSIAQIKGTIPYVDAVTHHEPAEGGAPEESLEALRVLAPRRLRHRGRATALSDFEDLALEASPEVARAKGIGPQTGEEAGSVGLLIVPRSAQPKPVLGLGLLDLVRAHVEERLSPVVDLWVAGPDWLQVTVEAEIAPRVLEEALDVLSAVRARIDAFLHPLTGGPEGTGWAFGRKPYRSDLYAWIEATPGVDHVRWLQVEETPEEGGARPERFLIFPGDHRITLAGSTDEAGDGGSPP